MRNEIPVPLVISGDTHLFYLNNPVGDSPAQIVGIDADGVAFRYTLGDAEPELFPELNVDYWVTLNDSGTFCGLHRGPKIKNRVTSELFRFNQSFELLPMPSDGLWPQPMGINSSGDMVTVGSIYRDDWGWVNVDDLVVGTRADVRVFRHSATIYAMTDRAGQTDSAQITGATDTSLFILTPEPAPTP